MCWLTTSRSFVVPKSAEGLSLFDELCEQAEDPPWRRKKLGAEDGEEEEDVDDDENDDVADGSQGQAPQ